MTENLLKIGITQGDPNGIGWEVILKTVSNPLLTELCTPILYGSEEAMNFYRKTIQELDSFEVVKVKSAAEAREGKINLVECGSMQPTPGKPTTEAGAAAVEALKRATEELLEASPENLRVVADLTNIDLAAGQYTVNAKIYFDGVGDAGVQGTTYPLAVRLTDEKKPTT